MTVDLKKRDRIQLATGDIVIIEGLIWNNLKAKDTLSPADQELVRILHTLHHAVKRRRQRPPVSVSV